MDNKHPRIPFADLLSTFTGLLTLADLDAIARVDLDAVERYAMSMQSDGGGQSGSECGLSRRVLSETGRDHVPHDDFLDGFRIHAGPSDRFFNHEGSELRGLEALECS